jgi:hypothetical protein
VAVTREQLLADPKSGARPLSRDEQAERACNAEVAAQWFAATSPLGRRCQVQVSHAEVLRTCAAPGGASTSPARRPNPNPRRCRA